MTERRALAILGPGLFALRLEAELEVLKVSARKWPRR
jgi:hypothetical protein